MASGRRPLRHVLVFQIGSFGDTLVSLPALHVLRAHVGPAGRIVMLHDDQGDGRVRPPEILGAPLVDDFVAYPFRTGRAARAAVALRLARRLRVAHFDAVVNLTLTDRPADSLGRDRRFFKMCGIRERIGFDGGDGIGTGEAEARLQRLRAVGIDDPMPAGPLLSPDADAVSVADRWLAAGGDLAAHGIVTLAPDTLMPAKLWDDDRWRELGRRICAAGFEPVVVGGPAVASFGDDLVASWPTGRNAAGVFDVHGSGAVVARSRVHVGLDTGTTHLAAALGRPVVALFSRRAPVEQWRPIGTEVSLLSHPVPCDGCAAVECPVAGHPCMTGITVDAVWAAVESHLGLHDDASTDA